MVQRRWSPGGPSRPAVTRAPLAAAGPRDVLPDIECRGVGDQPAPSAGPSAGIRGGSRGAARVGGSPVSGRRYRVRRGWLSYRGAGGGPRAGR